MPAHFILNSAKTLQFKKTKTTDKFKIYSGLLTLKKTQLLLGFFL